MDTKIFVNTRQKTLFTKSFMVAGVGFLGIMLIGIIAWLSIDAAGVLKGVNKNTSFNFAMYKKLNTLAKISIASGVLIIASMLLSIYWSFRFHTISKEMAYIIFTIYIIGEGLGFGILFATWNAIELIAIFGIAASAFLIMGTIGYYAKDLSFLGRGLFVYGMFIMLLWLTTFLLARAGYLNIKPVYSIMTIAFGIFFLLYIAYDVWMLKKTSEWLESSNHIDKDYEIKLMLFFGFHLLIDFIGLVRTITRLFIYFRS